MHGGRKNIAAPEAGHTRPGAALDWFAIRLLFTLGLPPSAIVRTLPKRDGKPVVARQVIDRRAKREGWSEQRISG